MMPFRDTFRDTFSFPHADSLSESLFSDSHQECPLSRAHPRRKVPAQAQVFDCGPDDLPVSLEGHLSGHDDHGKSVRCSCRQCPFLTRPMVLIKQDPTRGLLHNTGSAVTLLNSTSSSTWRSDDLRPYSRNAPRCLLCAALGQLHLGQADGGRLLQRYQSWSVEPQKRY